MGAVTHCAFPRCGRKPRWRLCSDFERGLACQAMHAEKNTACPECYRGEVCTGCRTRARHLDNGARAEFYEGAFLSRRPYSRVRVVLDDEEPPEYGFA